MWGSKKQEDPKSYGDATNAGFEAKGFDESPEAKSREDAEGRSASIVHRSLWDEENEASGRTKVSSETLQGELWNRSEDLFSPSLDSVYETAKTERTNASRCPKDLEPKYMTSLPLRRKERKTLAFATSSEESEEEGFRSGGATKKRVKTRRKQSKHSSSRRRETRSSSSSSRERTTKSKYGTAPSTPWQSPKSSHRTRTKSKTPKRGSSSDESSSSEQDGNESLVRISRPKHILKPPKFDGVMSFETFWAQFKNCAEHNGWDRTQKLVYLRSSLDKEAANVLWDYGKEVTESLSGLTKTLKMRFGGKAFADKHRIEIRNRRRKPDETLQSLHIDIRRLAALAFPSMEHRTREVIACDYFLDALADPEFALKIRERYPQDLDSALRIALQLEVWTKDSTRFRKLENEKERSEAKRTREVTGPKIPSQDQTNEALQNESTNSERR